MKYFPVLLLVTLAAFTVVSLPAVLPDNFPEVFAEEGALAFTGLANTANQAFLIYVLFAAALVGISWFVVRLGRMP